MIKAPPTPKGFRDIQPELAKKRRGVIGKIAATLEENGFVPIETPTIEFADTLKGKYGEEEHLIYEFEDRGGRKLALRYDLTVPLARFVASNLNLIAKGPFRRYQVGNVFRGENPQRGRWREFTQFDFDTVGSPDVVEDARIIATALTCCKKLGLPDAQMRVNDRKNFETMSKDAVIAVDKLEKIGEEGVVNELSARGMSKDDATALLQDIRSKKPTQHIEKILEGLNEFGVDKVSCVFDPLLARGLNYYTGSIFELRLPSYGNLSLGGGGRYDKLIGMFARSASSGQAKKDIPAVGFSFGLDRLIELLPDEI